MAHSRCADTLSAVDDLWHAACDSHDNVRAGSPKDLDSLDTALKTIDNRVGDAAAVGTSSDTIGSRVKIYTSTYKTERWSGELIRKIVEYCCSCRIYQGTIGKPLKSFQIFLRKEKSTVQTHMVTAALCLTTAISTCLIKLILMQQPVAMLT